ncbi:MAG: conserved phage C-terminal domain-containing protein [Shewanella sp.]
MKWFKHDTNASSDSKLQNVLLDYGLEGYGLYWYCIELIAGNVDADNITFSLEHDARIIARNTGSTAQKVEEMMRYFVTIGLFENCDGVITCMKLAKRIDQSMTSNPAMRAIINSFKLAKGSNIANSAAEESKSHDVIKVNHDSVMQDKIRLDQIRKEEIREETKDSMSKPAVCDDAPKPAADERVKLVIDLLNSMTGSKYKPSTKSHASHIIGRLNEGHSVDDLMEVVRFKCGEWLHDPKMAQYLRPETLFQAGKFNGYLTAAKAEQGPLSGLSAISRKNAQNLAGDW